MVSEPFFARSFKLDFLIRRSNPDRDRLVAIEGMKLTRVRPVKVLNSSGAIRVPDGELDFGEVVGEKFFAA